MWGLCENRVLCNNISYMPIKPALVSGIPINSLCLHSPKEHTTDDENENNLPKSHIMIK